MSADEPNKQQTAADILAFAEELEASGDAALNGTPLERARTVLHKWVDSVTGVVNTPAFGRVTLLHGKGRQSTISSTALSFAITMPIDWEARIEGEEPESE